jgi:hypothetical protein
MKHPLLRSLLLAGLVYGLGACRAGPPGGEPPAQTPAASSPAGVTNAPPGTQTPSGLAGVVLSASDVTGQPDQPLAGQLLVALPAAQAGEVLGLGSQTLDPARLRFIKASLPQKDSSMAVTLSDADGRYTLLLNPGEYVLCVADSEKSPADFPATTRGCGLATVLAGRIRQVDISSGFGEILLVER